jgi:predicted GTPase
MIDNISAKNVTIEIDEVFISIRIQATDIDIFETLLNSLKDIVFQGTPISLKQICNYHPSSSQKMISKIITKGSDIEKCIEETKQLVSILRR